MPPGSMSNAWPAASLNLEGGFGSFKAGASTSRAVVEMQVVDLCERMAAPTSTCYDGVCCWPVRRATNRSMPDQRVWYPAIGSPCASSDNHATDANQGLDPHK